MLLLYFALFAAAILSGCMSQGEREIDFSQPVSPADYQRIIKQGFTTNYFKTLPPAHKYQPENIEIIFAKGFRNVRLRSRAGLYTAPYNSDCF